MWQSIAQAEGANSLKVEQFMEGWREKKGFPLVVVSRYPGDEDLAVMTQHRFVIDSDRDAGRRDGGCVDREQDDHCVAGWDIPLTYKFQNGGKMERKWFPRNATSVVIPWRNKSEWVKTNLDQIGFYRVHYDLDNWEALTKQLKHKHSVFSTADRANLMQDAFALARANFRVDDISAPRERICPLEDSSAFLRIYRSTSSKSTWTQILPEVYFKDHADEIERTRSWYRRRQFGKANPYSTHHHSS